VTERTICGKCKNQRFLVWLFGWDRKTGKRVGAWKPFDRARWQAHGDLELSAMTLAKALKPCEDCNRDGLAPWDDRFRTGDGAPEPEGAGAPPV
jgi:hypothetical protein